MTLSPDTRLRLPFYRLRSACRQAVSSLQEKGDLLGFQEFYQRLPRHEDVIFMFFTTDLLHWLRRALEFVPPEANVVLIGSQLKQEEIAWIASLTARPFHHIESRVDDNTVLDFIFQTTRHSFGWLHIDCFVLNPSLFQEMAAVRQALIDDLGDHVLERGVAPSGGRTLAGTLKQVYADALASVSANEPTYVAKLEEAEDRLVEHYRRALAECAEDPVVAVLAEHLPTIEAAHRRMQRVKALYRA